MVIADTETGKVFSLMKAYRVNSYDIAPNGEYVAVTVYLGFETPTSRQQIYDLYILPLPKKLDEASSTEIEPLVRKIPLGDGITVSWSPDSKFVAWTTVTAGG